MACLTTVSKSSCDKDVETERIIVICLFIQKIEFKFRILPFCGEKWREIQILNCYIFWMDRHITIILFV